MMRFEDAHHNYSLLASVMEEPEKSTRLNNFYEYNKVMQGINCFFMLDNQAIATRGTMTDNFSDPNFCLGPFFDEKTKITDARTTPQQQHFTQESHNIASIDTNFLRPNDSQQPSSRVEAGAGELQQQPDYKLASMFEQ